MPGDNKKKDASNDAGINLSQYVNTPEAKAVREQYGLHTSYPGDEQGKLVPLAGHEDEHHGYGPDGPQSLTSATNELGHSIGNLTTDLNPVTWWNWIKSNVGWVAAAGGAVLVLIVLIFLLIYT